MGLSRSAAHVNPRREVAFGQPAYPSLAAIPDLVDRAVIVTPAPTLSGVQEDVRAAGVRGVTVAASGFQEAGPAGRALSRSVKLGIGVDTDEGLLVGVLLDAGYFGLAKLSARRRAIAKRTQAGQATNDEFRGSTFTSSNLGSAGIDAFTPIINPPEVAILGIGWITDEPTPAGVGVVWRKSIILSLTVDHRAVNGARQRGPRRDSRPPAGSRRAAMTEPNIPGQEAGNDR